MYSSFSMSKTGFEHVNRDVIAETFAKKFKRGTKFPTKKDLLAAAQALAQNWDFKSVWPAMPLNALALAKIFQ